MKLKKQSDYSKVESYDIHAINQDKKSKAVK